jgi:hypothetical protein
MTKINNNKFPEIYLDVKSLKKGDYISPDTIKRILGNPDMDIRTNEYAFGVMQLQLWIERESRMNGDNFTTKSESFGICVLEDNESEIYLRRRQLQSLDSFRKLNYKYNNNIDTSNLNSVEKQTFDENKYRFGFIMDRIDTGFLKLNRKFKKFEAKFNIEDDEDDD